MKNPCPKCGASNPTVRGVPPSSCHRCGHSFFVLDPDALDGGGPIRVPDEPPRDEMAELATVVARPAIQIPPPSPRSLVSLARTTEAPSAPPRVRSAALPREGATEPPATARVGSPIPSPNRPLIDASPAATTPSAPRPAARSAEPEEEAPIEELGGVKQFGDVHRPAGPITFELQHAIGDAVQGPFDRITLREMIYAGRLTGDERIRIPGTSAFTRLADRPEFAAVLAVSDRGTSHPAPRSVRGGWRRADGGPPGAPELPAEPTMPPFDPPEAGSEAASSTSAPAAVLPPSSMGPPVGSSAGHANGAPPSAPVPSAAKARPTVDMRRKTPFGLILGILVLLALGAVAIRMLMQQVNSG